MMLFLLRLVRDIVRALVTAAMMVLVCYAVIAAILFGNMTYPFRCREGDTYKEVGGIVYRIHIDKNCVCDTMVYTDKNPGR
ncbi:MAG TPA: hypothetical protein PKZ07_14510 [Sedimentisphaerales bacterium]|nr:hypothetical protein [Sedimentisphaerales bacterium]